MNSSKKRSYSIQHVGLNFREATSATAEKNKHGLKMSRKVSKLIAYKIKTVPGNNPARGAPAE